MNPLRGFQWAQDEHRTLYKPPPPRRVAQKRKVSKIWRYKTDMMSFTKLIH